MDKKKTYTAKIETEAKFIVPDESTFIALKQVTNVGDFQLRPAGTKVISDRYLDTPDKRFFQAGYACRIRTAKQKQTLTLKSLSPPAGNIHRRQEFELEVDTDQPAAWPPSETKDLALSIMGDESLYNLFILHQSRHKYHVLSESQPLIELSLDEVKLGDINKVDYFELEAELFEVGTDADLIQFVDILQSNWSLKPETRSKFERAFDGANF